MCTIDYGINFWLKCGCYLILHCYSKVIKERRNKTVNSNEESKKDLLQIIMDTQENGVYLFKDNDVLSQTMSFMIAGHETTSMTMTWSILLLAKYPEYQERAREEIRRVLGDRDELTFEDTKEMTFLDNCIKESMRLYPAIVTANRETVKDVKFGKFVIPKNTKIKVDIASIHRNEKYWKEANRFNPDRYDEEKGNIFISLIIEANKKRGISVASNVKNKKQAFYEILEACFRWYI